MSFANFFLDECAKSIQGLDSEKIDRSAELLSQIRLNGGRLFAAGSGGGAGHASHAVCDFRKLCNIDAYAPYDNTSELTARVNDEGWETSLSNSLKVSRLDSNDGLLLFSVGGGDEVSQVSVNLINAAKYAGSRGAKVIAIVGRDGGYLGRCADVAILIPPVNDSLVTPITEGLQAVVWHMLVSHPLLNQNAPKWESMAASAVAHDAEKISAAKLLNRFNQTSKSAAETTSVAEAENTPYTQPANFSQYVVPSKND